MQYNSVYRGEKMGNRFTNFTKAQDEVQEKNCKVDVVSEEERKKTYSFTLLPSERQMLKELAEQSSIKVSDSQFLGSIIREYYKKLN